MKITDKQPTTKRISELYAGDVFLEAEEHEYYIMTDMIASGYVMCINLNTGRRTPFDFDAQVISVDVEMIVKEKQ